MFDGSRRLRLGVGGLGSIPGIALTVVAFVVLALIRQASLVLVPTNPDASTAKRKKKERPPMVTRPFVDSKFARDGVGARRKRVGWSATPHLNRRDESRGEQVSFTFVSWLPCWSDQNLVDG
jgi:hypothetical protein